MPKKIIFPDTAERLEEIRDAMGRATDPRYFERCRCIYLLLTGVSRQEIARLLDRGLDTVGGYIRAYCTSGLAGLERDHSPGRPKRLTPEQEAEIHQTLLAHTPESIGLHPGSAWTSSLVCRWIEQQFGVHYTERGTRLLLHRLGLVYSKRPSRGVREQEEAWGGTGGPSS